MAGKTGRVKSTTMQGSDSLALVAVVMFGRTLLGLDLVLHRLHEVPRVVGLDDVLLGCRDHLA